MVFNLFRKSDDNQPHDVKSLREAILRFIKESLQKIEGGEGGHIKELKLFIDNHNEDLSMYEGAVYIQDKQLFKNEIQRLADDFAINLPNDWTLDVEFVDSPPSDARQSTDLDVAFIMNTRKQVAHNSAAFVAYLRILNGEAEQEEYLIKATDPKLNIGRDKKSVTENGSFRLNQLVFPGDSRDESNKYISRQHAHIEFDMESERFMIFADDGGVPPRNKTKIHVAADGKMIKLNSTQIGHPLHEGDQVILGESAVFLFSAVK